MSLRTESTALRKILVERIRQGGPITFAEYMQCCLYDPEFGYYTANRGARRGDYYTSVDMSPVFGRLIARQLHEMWAVLDRPDQFFAVECGAAAGGLALGILDLSRDEFPDFYGTLRYEAVEISPARRDLAVQKLAAHIAAGHAFVRAEMPAAVPQGCILANEFLDALPVHRVVMSAGDLREIYVDVVRDDLIERLMPPSAPGVREFFARQHAVLHDEQQAEAGLPACRWIEDAGRKLGRGFVLVIDYGREARELYDEHHMRGTLLAYSDHRASEDFYHAPGEQDLTAHVNFAALDLWGRDSGLIRTGLTSQTNFLLSLAHRSGFADLDPNGADEVGKLRTRLQFKSLIYPEGMGETFQVMVQHKGIAAPRLTGMDPL
jgi:SAM-dependent MidA family methyltransferase